MPKRLIRSVNLPRLPAIPKASDEALPMATWGAAMCIRIIAESRRKRMYSALFQAMALLQKWAALIHHIKLSSVEQLEAGAPWQISWDDQPQPIARTRYVNGRRQQQKVIEAEIVEHGQESLPKDPSA